jgi:hypothetical protein
VVAMGIAAVFMGMDMPVPVMSMGMRRRSTAWGKMELFFFAYELNRDGIGWLATSAGSTHGDRMIKKSNNSQGLDPEFFSPDDL